MIPFSYASLLSLTLPVSAGPYGAEAGACGAGCGERFARSKFWLRGSISNGGGVAAGCGCVGVGGRGCGTGSLL